MKLYKMSFHVHNFRMWVGRGSALDTAKGAYNAPSDLLVGWRTPFYTPHPRRLWRLDYRAILLSPAVEAFVHTAPHTAGLSNK